MPSKQKMTGTAMTMPGGLALGAAISILLTTGCSGLLAKLIDLEIMTWENIGYGIMVIVLISAFAGAETAAKKIKHRKLFVCLLSGMIYWATLLCITALLFGGQYESVGITGGVIFAGSTCAALLNGQSKRRIVTKKYKVSR